MSGQIYNVYTQHADPEGVLEVLRERMPGAKVARLADGQWNEVNCEWSRGWFRGSATLRVTQNPEFYTGPEWGSHVAGMEGYLRNFIVSNPCEDIFAYVRTLKFAVNFILAGDLDEDPRLKTLLAVAQHLDGVIFTPACLLDQKLRVLLSADGVREPEAILPGSGDPSAHFAPPSELEVSARLQLMAGLVQRGIMERSEGHRSDDDRYALWQALKPTMAWQIAEPFERQALEKPVGSLEPRLVWQLPWMAEGAVVLAWALRLLPRLPSYDEQANYEDVMIAAEESLSREPGLRPRGELERLSQQMLAIHWRLREFSLRKQPMDFAAYAPKSWAGKMDLTLAVLKEKDLAIRGVPIAKSDMQDWKGAAGIMEERRKAMAWLLGEGPVYSEIQVHT